MVDVNLVGVPGSTSQTGWMLRMSMCSMLFNHVKLTAESRGGLI